jgi:hypothetical protein
MGRLIAVRPVGSWRPFRSGDRKNSERAFVLRNYTFSVVLTSINSGGLQYNKERASLASAVRSCCFHTVRVSRAAARRRSRAARQIRQRPLSRSGRGPSQARAASISNAGQLLSALMSPADLFLAGVPSRPPLALAIEHILDCRCVPLAPTRGFHPARIKHFGNISKRSSARLLYRRDDWEHLGGELVSSSLDARSSKLTGLRQIAAAKNRASSLRGG